MAIKRFLLCAWASPATANMEPAKAKAKAVKASFLMVLNPPLMDEKVLDGDIPAGVGPQGLNRRGMRGCPAE
jgi:hypothetical protein